MHKAAKLTKTFILLFKLLLRIMGILSREMMRRCNQVNFFCFIQSSTLLKVIQDYDYSIFLLSGKALKENQSCQKIIICFLDQTVKNYRF